MKQISQQTSYYAKLALLSMSVCTLMTACHTAMASEESGPPGVSSPGFEGEGAFPTQDGTPPPPEPAIAACPHQEWVGHPVSEIKPLLKTIPNRVRILYPDSPATMDYSPDRLNIILEKGTDVITEVRCS